MKSVGIGLIVFVAFLFGYEKRASCIWSEKLSLTLASFFEDLSYRISYSGEPLTAVLHEMAEQLKYKSFDFILLAIDSSADGSIALSDALISAFKESNLCRLLTSEERDCINQLFSDFAETGKEHELEKLKAASASLKRTAEEKRSDNAKKRGFYEIMYTLAGTTLAILLA